MNIIRVGVDIAKSVFHAHGVDRHLQATWHSKYSRQNWPSLRLRVPKGIECEMTNMALPVCAEFLGMLQVLSSCHNAFL